MEPLVQQAVEGKRFVFRQQMLHVACLSLNSHVWCYLVQIITILTQWTPLD
jgi:hypothetical protein